MCFIGAIHFTSNHPNQITCGPCFKEVCPGSICLVSVKPVITGIQEIKIMAIIVANPEFFENNRFAHLATNRDVVSDPVSGPGQVFVPVIRI
jgi:hypothetical protein